MTGARNTYINGSMPKINTEEDFWNRVDKSKECWNWTGCKSDRGYGKVFFYGKDWRAHRLSYYWKTGELPQAVCHKCDNPSCVNPDHLFSGTNGINNTDRSLKGRNNSLLGSRHQNSKLTEEQVLSIRSEAKFVSMRAIAIKYSVSRWTINDIVNRRRWAWLK